MTARALLAPLLVLLAALAALAWPTQAEAKVVCSVGTMSIAFGSNSTATGALNYSCISYDATSTTLTLCGVLGSPSYPGSVAQPKMLSGSNTLNFNLYTTAARTAVWVGSSTITKSMTIAAGASLTGSIPFYGTIPSGQGAALGNYTAEFYGTSMGIISGGTCQERVSGVYDGNNGTLSVSATVVAACTVSASNLSFGTVSSTATNLSGSTSLSVTCPNGTAYYIGLAPSNGNTAGAGTMTGTGGNTDQPAYQLRSTSGSGGTVWGNTATSSSVGNGISGTGTGSAQSRTIYATMANANYTPDSYSDTVTITVNY